MSHSDNILANWFEIAVNFVGKNKRMCLATGGIAICLIGGVVGYRWYDEQVQNNAYTAFVELLKLSDASIKKEGEADDDRTFSSLEEKWSRVAVVAKDNASEHSGSGLAPLFHMMIGEAALHLNKKQEALEHIKRGLDCIKDKTFADAWQVKAASIALDSGDEKFEKEGLGLLIERAQDKQSAAQQYALYQLGDYFWHKHDFVQAKNYWQQLLVQHADRSSDVGTELFIDKVRSKLALIAAEE